MVLFCFGEFPVGVTEICDVDEPCDSRTAKVGIGKVKGRKRKVHCRGIYFSVFGVWPRLVRNTCSTGQAACSVTVAHP